MMSVELTVDDIELLNKVQKNFPLCSDPFTEIGKSLSRDKTEIIQRLNQLKESGFISRFGGVNNHKKMGASTLAALKVPPARIDEVAEFVNSFEEVNHNYLRENEFNMWFVVTAASENLLEKVLTRLTQESGCELLNLPMLKSHHIDLAFKI